MSKAVEKFRKAYGECLSQFLDDANICGFPHMVAATLQRLRLTFEKNGDTKYKVVKSVDASLVYDRTKQTMAKLAKSKRYNLQFNGHNYDELFVDEALRVLEGVVRIEEWQIDGKDDDGKPLLIFSLLLIDVNNDCVIIAHKAPDKEPFIYEGEEIAPPEEDEVIGNIEDLITKTFDPLAW